MTLRPGSRFGAYEIRSVLGTGGMGEVYRGHDTQLNRSVALKVLLDGLAADPAHLARLKREAQLLASLNHPHIAAIYGLEESDGAHALVLELVEGETLAARLARGPLPIAEALSIAGQIAEALRAAHESGIVHRDLKPANIKLREDGVVKVLDFGIAKSIAPIGDRGPSAPTLAAPLTERGLLVGTPAFMAPEQVSGKAADKRSDVWAFGCVLFEMLTGRQAFPGRDVGEILAAVLSRDPDWSLLAPQVSPSIRALLRRCLVRDPRARLGDLAAAQFVLEEQAALTTSVVEIVTPPPRPAPSWRQAVLGAMLLAAAAAGGAVWYLTRGREPSPRTVRLALVTAPAAAPSFTDTADQYVGIAPDGSWVTYVGSGSTQLFVRPLDAIDSRVILTTASYIRGVFVSDDGQWLGYVENYATLRKVAVAGGAPVTVARMGGASRGATWSSERGIVFATVTPDSGLQRVDPSGGEVTVLTKPDAAREERDHVYPQFLPDDRHVLFTIAGGSAETARVAVLDLETGAWRTLVTGGFHGRYVSSGHLVYATAHSTGTALRAVAFDLARLEVRGSSVEVVPSVLADSLINMSAAFSVSPSGTLVYQSVPAGMSHARTLVWVDREGRESTLDSSARSFTEPRVSPDGRRLAVSTIGDLWLLDLSKPSELTRLTVAPGLDFSPVWTPDSQRLVFASSRDGDAIYDIDLYVQSVDGGTAERLTESGASLPSSITADGAVVLGGGGGVQRLWIESRAAETLMEMPYPARNFEVSPDGRWLAYEAQQAAERPGQPDIYVRPFPNTSAAQWQVSTAGGRQPVWARNGDEIFYLAPDGAMMAVRVASEGAQFRWEDPVRLFPASRASIQGRDYDVAPDGRFVMVKEKVDPSLLPPHIVVVQNFDQELKRLAP